MNKLLPCLLAALASAAPGASRLAAAEPAGYKLIVHQDNATTSLTRADAARMFLKKVTSWPDRTPIVAVDQERTSPVRAAFSADVHEKDADAISAYWQVLVYSGRDLPPRILKSDDEVMAFVRTNPGGLGYVSADAKLSGVKVVTLR